MLSVKKLDAATDSFFPGIEDNMSCRRLDESAEPLLGRRRLKSAAKVVGKVRAFSGQTGEVLAKPITIPNVGRLR